MSHSSSGVAARSSTPNHCRARQRAMTQRAATAGQRWSTKVRAVLGSEGNPRG